MHRMPGEIPHHKTKNIKLMAVVHRLQQIMVNENLTPDELVGCAEIVRDNYRRFNDISRQKSETFRPANMPKPPPRRP
ncbi:hypothetical protein ACVBBW_003685 [Escherichia coli]|uniref:hypothetical protein n=1 Tax=Escherichia coli TaxID=562 RepID=UPI0003EDD66E|nr:hypothetical protein [Escherichia coli]EGD9748576.1 hypothetical protein [Escherichia coli]MCU8829902.1 hypothetical protein [Escherichia coli]OKT75491.1 hypothetical protein ACN68_03500 [Escherichia coli]OKU08528.1 hypothetical protein ACN77_22395 [Escherichia coli]HAH1093601.1 hypothetical protein [Escherichia coli]